MTAVMCVLAPMSIPIGPVPVSFTNLVIYFSLCILGTKRTFLSYTVYFLLGLAGLPVFSGFSGGVAKVVGPTGGCLVGFFVMILLSGYFIDRFGNKFIRFAGMLAGIAVVYAMAMLWFSFVMQTDLKTAFLACAAPFVVIDILKMLAALYFGEKIKRRINAN